MGEDRELIESFLEKTSESIHNLYTLTSQIDERVKLIKERYDEFNKRLDSTMAAFTSILERVAVLESRNHMALSSQVDEVQEELISLDKRIDKLEASNNRFHAGWNQVIGIALQVATLIIASFLLYYFNLPS